MEGYMTTKEAADKWDVSVRQILPILIAGLNGKLCSLTCLALSSRAGSDGNLIEVGAPV